MVTWIPIHRNFDYQSRDCLPSKNPAIAALQDQAKQWLEFEAPKFRLVTSQFVIDEASRGDPDAAKRRLAAWKTSGFIARPGSGITRRQNRNRLHDASKSSIDALHVASAVLAG